MPKIGPLEIKSRSLLGIGRSEDEATQTKAAEAAEANVLTFAVERMNLCDKSLPNPLVNIDLKDFVTFPNTASAKTAEEAIRIAETAKHAEVCDMAEVEVIGGDEILLPDSSETYEACKVLLEKGYIICLYISSDVISAKRLEELGVHAVVPLASPVGIGHGINSQLNLSYIVRHSNVPVIVDAGIGSPKDVCHAMGLGADAILSDTAASGAKDPIKTAEAMGLSIHVGRLSYEVGHTPVRHAARAPGPTEGLGFL